MSGGRLSWPSRTYGWCRRSLKTGQSAERSRVDGSTTDKTEELDLEDQNSEAAIDADEEAIAEAASIVGAIDASPSELRQELAVVDEMVAFAEHVVLKPDARVQWLAMDKGEHVVRRRWNNRRLIIFTEWEDTRRWVEKRLREALAETDQIDRRSISATSSAG